MTSFSPFYDVALATAPPAVVLLTPSPCTIVTVLSLPEPAISACCSATHCLVSFQDKISIYTLPTLTLCLTLPPYPSITPTPTAFLLATPPTLTPLSCATLTLLAPLDQYPPPPPSCSVQSFPLTPSHVTSKPLPPVLPPLSSYPPLPLHTTHRFTPTHHLLTHSTTLNNTLQYTTHTLTASGHLTERTYALPAPAPGSLTAHTPPQPPATKTHAYIGRYTATTATILTPTPTRTPSGSFYVHPSSTDEGRRYTVTLPGTAYEELEVVVEEEFDTVIVVSGGGGRFGMGDCVVKVNGQAVESVEGYYRAVEEVGAGEVSVVGVFGEEEGALTGRGSVRGGYYEEGELDASMEKVMVGGWSEEWGEKMAVEASVFEGLVGGGEVGGVRGVVAGGEEYLLSDGWATNFEQGSIAKVVNLGKEVRVCCGVVYGGWERIGGFYGGGGGDVVPYCYDGKWESSESEGREGLGALSGVMEAFREDVGSAGELVRFCLAGVRAQVPLAQASLASAGAFLAFNEVDGEDLVGMLRKTLAGSATGSFKFTMDSVARCSLPVIIRGSARIKTIACEIAGSEYKRTGDVLKSSLLYLACGKKATIVNLAKIDGGDRGRNFVKLCTGWDYSTVEGRVVAEKNAFSLLRKREHVCAAAVFLLCDPPMLEACVDILCWKVKDFNLALLVARCVEGEEGLGPIGRKIAREWGIERGEGGAEDEVFDDVFKALLWEVLGERRRAIDVLAGAVAAGKDQVFAVPESNVLPGINLVVNYFAIPVILEQLGAPEHVVTPVGVTVAGVSERGGMCEVGLRVVERFVQKGEGEEGRREGGGVGTAAANPMAGGASIFDSFDAPPPKRKPPPAVDAMASGSSIFDSFDAPPPKPKLVPAVDAMAGSSSIFDSYDAPPSKPKLVPAVDAMANGSSIFDSFDAPLPKPKPAPAVDAMANGSSIFDSFDGPPKPPPASAPASIFDSFDPPPRAATAAASQPSPPPSATPPPSPPPPDTSAQLKFSKRFKKEILLSLAAQQLASELSRHVPGYSIDPTANNHNERIMGVLLEFSTDGVMKSLRSSLAKLLLDFFSNFEESLATTSEDIVAAALKLELALPVRALLLQAINDTSTLNSLVASSCLLLLKTNSAAIISNSINSSNNLPIHLPDVQERVTTAWHLELLSWLHRGRNLDLSESAADLITVSVRYQMFTAVHKCTRQNSGQFHGMDVVRMLLDHEPDCFLDFERDPPSILPEIVPDFTVGGDGIEITPAEGPAEPDNSVKKILGKGGGWQFLVDCSREEANQLLAEEPVGAFLIRPAQNQPDVFSLSFQSNAGASAVQHAVVRLEETGFRCGSYGPFPKLYQVLEAVSALLPTPLLFAMDSVGGESRIRMERDSLRGSEGSISGLTGAVIHKSSSANCLFFRSLRNRTKTKEYISDSSVEMGRVDTSLVRDVKGVALSVKEDLVRVIAGIFMELSVVTKLVQQLFAIGRWNDVDTLIPEIEKCDSKGSLAYHFLDPLKELLVWHEQRFHALVNVDREIMNSIAEADAGAGRGSLLALGDEVVRMMIRAPAKDGGNVEFKPYRITPAEGEKDDGIVAVMFSKKQACLWFAREENDALLRKCAQALGTGVADRVATPLQRVLLASDILDEFERGRVVERIGANDAGGRFVVTHGSQPDKDIAAQFVTWTGNAGTDGVESVENVEEALLRFVDPWEVDCFNSGIGALASGYLGRHWFEGGGDGGVGSDALDGWVMRNDGIEGLCLWHNMLSKDDLIGRVVGCLEGGKAGGEEAGEEERDWYRESLESHAYRNGMYKLLSMNTRFVCLVQVTLLDVKNLSPGGISGSGMFAVVRLKREGSNAPCTNKNRTKDSCLSEGGKGGKGGMNCCAQFRFPLPEGIGSDLAGFDEHRERLFKGPPTLVKIGVYEKRSFLGDSLIGFGDTPLKTLVGANGEGEDWLPLAREGGGAGGHFVRVRVNVRFEVMRLKEGGGV